MRLGKVGGIILDNEYILLIKGRYSHKWNVPKGSREQGESMRETGIRELHEETGNTFEITKYDIPVKVKKVFLYVIRGSKHKLFLNPIDTGEIEDIRWFKIRDIDTEIPVSETTGLLTSVVQYLLKNNMTD
jgi:8-oxo-dGTP pyrophosphatase MutT (NUDIX family)